jgi:hypothetical protein
MRGFAGGSRAWSEDRRVRRGDFQGCAGSGKLAFRTEGCGSSHILGRMRSLIQGPLRARCICMSSQVHQTGSWMSVRL